MKQIAMLLSPSKDFIREYLPALKKNDFKIVQVDSFESLQNNPLENRFDIAFIDNPDGQFPYEDFFDFLQKHHPQAIIINVSKPESGNSPKLAPRVRHNLFFNSNNGQVNLGSLIENLSEYFRRDRSRTELAAMLIHDIRSPMNSLIAYIELMLNETFGPLNEGQKKFLEKAMVLGDQTLDMLEDINETYKSEQHVFSLEKTKFSIHKVIDQALMGIWIQADQKNIQIKKSLPLWVPKISGDSFQIQRIIVNLLENAIKYCPENSTVTLKVVRLSARLLEISVVDNGGGIPEDKLSSIFKKSFRIKDAAQLQKGYGLGLYICKLLIRAHGGTIRAENNSSGGVSFIVTLPTT